MNEQISVIKVLKNNGDLVPFNFDKLKSALVKSGAQRNEIQKVSDEVQNQLYDGITTKKIYKIAYRILKKHSKSTAGRYRLKKALLELGPSGYSFEKFMGRLFEQKGYNVKVGEIVNGACVTHEVDVIAEKDNEIIMVECKFHNQPGRKSDVKVALYIKSRFDDIKNTLEKEDQLQGKHFQGYVATNTRFTDDAIQYGTCAGLSLLSWNYPLGNSLQKWIEDADYHPITALGSISKRIKTKLLENDIVLCREVIGNDKRLLEIGISPKDIQKMTKEAIEIVKL